MSTTVQLATPADAEQFTQWLGSTPHNGLDPSIATYPSLQTLKISMGGEPVLYVPAHVGLIIESVAARPGITPRQYIESLLVAEQATEALARHYQLSEIHTSSNYRPMQRTLARHGY